MSGNQKPASGLRAWMQEEAVTTRNPSWIAPRKASSRPPEPRPSSQPVSGEAPQSVELAACGEADAASAGLALSAEIARLNDENAVLRAQLAELASAMVRLRREVLESSETELVRLATAIAERVVGRELDAAPELVVHWAREAIQTLAAKDEVVIALSRDLAQRVPAEAWSRLDGGEHRVQADGLLQEGVLEARSDEGVVTSGAAARLAAVARSLGVADS